MNSVADIDDRESARTNENIDTDALDGYPQNSSSFHPLLIGGIVAALAVVGLLLRWHFLTHRDFWDDEGATVIFCQLPWGSFVRTITRYEANMSFYYLLVRGWLHLGDSEATIRAFSVLFGVAVIPATYALGKRLFGVQAGLFAAALATVNEFQIRYSQEARSYSLVMFLAIVSVYLLLRAIEEPSRKGLWYGYVLVNALGVYSHVFFYLVIVAEWLPLAYRQLRTQLKTTLWVAAGLLTATAPMTFFLLTKNQGQLNWVRPPTFLSVLDFAKFFVGYGGSPLLGIYCALCIVAIPTAYRARRNSTGGLDQRDRIHLVVSWLLFPIVSTLLVSLFTPIFFDRYMAISAPALVLLAGKGLADLAQIFSKHRLVAPGLVVLTIGLSLWGIHRYDTTLAGGDPWKSVTRYILTRQKPGDGAFFYRASGSRPFAYYCARAKEKGEATISPAIGFPADLSDALLFNVEPSQQQVIQGLGDYPGVWVILQHWEGLGVREQAVQTIQDVLEPNYHLVDERIFAGDPSPIRVSYYERTNR